jgi:hypothetical protein
MKFKWVRDTYVGRNDLDLRVSNGDWNELIVGFIREKTQRVAGPPIYKVRVTLSSRVDGDGGEYTSVRMAMRQLRRAALMAIIGGALDEV